MAKLKDTFVSLLQNIEKNIHSKIMMCSNFAPKTFLGRFPLHKGALFVGIFILAISIICVISLAVEILYYKQCENCSALVMHNVYGFSINAIVYCIIMIFINLWFIWGVKFEKSSVVLSWVVITSMWWAQSIVLVFVLMSMYITDTTLGWIVALASAMIAFMIFFYCILIGYGYWLELRKPPQTPVEQN